MTHEERLAKGFAEADVLDVAGRMIANPNRAMVSQAEKLAMAVMIERTWAVCLEAHLLVRWLQASDSDRRQAAIEEQAAIVAAHLAPLMGRTPKPQQET